MVQFWWKKRNSSALALHSSDYNDTFYLPTYFIDMHTYEIWDIESNACTLFHSLHQSLLLRKYLLTREDMLSWFIQLRTTQSIAKEEKECEKAYIIICALWMLFADCWMIRFLLPVMCTRAVAKDRPAALLRVEIGKTPDETAILFVAFEGYGGGVCRRKSRLHTYSSGERALYVLLCVWTA